jgi:hypothetical protein
MSDGTYRVDEADELVYVGEHTQWQWRASFRKGQLKDSWALGPQAGLNFWWWTAGFSPRWLAVAGRVRDDLLGRGLIEDR